MNLLFFLTPKQEVLFVYEDFTLRQTLEKWTNQRFATIPVLRRTHQTAHVFAGPQVIQIEVFEHQRQLADQFPYIPIRGLKADGGSSIVLPGAFLWAQGVLIHSPVLQAPAPGTVFFSVFRQEIQIGWLTIDPGRHRGDPTQIHRSPPIPSVCDKIKKGSSLCAAALDMEDILNNRHMLLLSSKIGCIYPIICI